MKRFFLLGIGVFFMTGGLFADEIVFEDNFNEALEKSGWKSFSESNEVRDGILTVNGAIRREIGPNSDNWVLEFKGKFTNQGLGDCQAIDMVNRDKDMVRFYKQGEFNLSNIMKNGTFDFFKGFPGDNNWYTFKIEKVPNAIKVYQDNEQVATVDGIRFINEEWLHLSVTTTDPQRPIYLEWIKLTAFPGSPYRTYQEPVIPEVSKEASIMENSSFENWGKGRKREPDNWVFYGNVPAERNADPDYVRSGKYSLKIIADRLFNGLHAPVPCKPNTTYRFSLWAAATEGSAKFQINTSRVLVDHLMFSEGKKLKLISVDVITDDKDEKFVIYLLSTTTISTFYVDDLRIEEIYE